MTALLWGIGMAKNEMPRAGLLTPKKEISGGADRRPKKNRRLAQAGWRCKRMTNYKSILPNVTHRTSAGRVCISVISKGDWSIVRAQTPFRFLTLELDSA